MCVLFSKIASSEKGNLEEKIKKMMVSDVGFKKVA